MSHDISEWANFQKLLFEAADEDPVVAAAEVINSNFIETEKDSIELLEQLLKVIRNYPGKLKQYAIFIKELIDKLNPDLHFRENFLKIFHENEKFIFLLYRHLFLLGLCQIEEIVSEFHQPKYDKSIRRTLLVTFLPELYQYDQETVRMAFNELSKEKDLFKTKMEYETFVDKIPKVEELLKQGQHTNSVEYAIKIDDADKLREFTSKKSFDLSAPLKSTEFELIPVAGLTPIGAAAIYGSVNCFKFLVMKQALDLPSPTPIVHLAIYGGNHEIVHILQQSKAKFDGALAAAAKSFRPSLFSWMLQLFPIGLIIKPVTANGILNELIKNGDLSSIISFFESELKDKLNDKLTPVFNCAKLSNGSVCFKYLFEQLNTDANATNSSGLTLLHVTNDVQIAEYLYSIPTIDVNILNKDGFSPLHEYATRGQVELSKLFLQHCPSGISVASKSGMTPLHCAAGSGKSEVIKYLIDQEGIDVNAIDRDGNTPLHYAARSTSKESVEALLSSPDIKVNIENKFKDTPYFLAAKFSNSDVFSALAEYQDVDINTVDENGMTALMYAIDRPCVSIFEYLLSRDTIDVNIPDKEFKKTALMHLVAAPWTPQVAQMLDTLLIVHGLDVNKQDKSGNTAIHIAVLLDKKDVVNVLSKVPQLNMNISNGILTVKEAIEGKHQRRLQKSKEASVERLNEMAEDSSEVGPLVVNESPIKPTPAKKEEPKKVENKSDANKKQTPQKPAAKKQVQTPTQNRRTSIDNKTNPDAKKPNAGSNKPASKTGRANTPSARRESVSERSEKSVSKSVSKSQSRSKSVKDKPTTPKSSKADDQMSTRPEGQPQGGCCRIF